MTGPGATWAFLGLLTGTGKLALVAAIGLLLFGRVAPLRRLLPRAWQPLLSAFPGARWVPRISPRGVLALKVLGWVALAAWLATRMTRIGTPP